MSKAVFFCRSGGKVFRRKNLAGKRYPTNCNNYNIPHMSILGDEIIQIRF